MMTKALRLTAHPVSRILCAKSHDIVGYLYEWNNGDRQPAWIGKPVRDVTYQPLDRAESGSAQSALMAGPDKGSKAGKASPVGVRHRGLC
jgi:hypothetical protein